MYQGTMQGRMQQKGLQKSNIQLSKRYATKVARH